MWTKKNLSRSAAQIAPAGTETKGHIALGKANQPIDPLTYFRTTLFGRFSWTPGPREETDVDFRVQILGVDRGVMTLTLSHDLRRVAGQGNVPTWLHWNDLNAYLKTHNTVGRTLRLCRGLLADGADFYLEIV